MNTICFQFPGQGSQFVGMGREIAAEYPVVTEYLERGGEILGFDLKRLCWEGPEEELAKTENTQPAIFALSAGLFDVLSGVTGEFTYTAGHSLGEYGAYHAAGYFDFETGIRAVRTRGLLMAGADPEERGTMASIIALDDETVRAVCEEASAVGLVVPVNYNCPGQVVISGAKEAVARACEIAEGQGGRIFPLSVSGAFHSPLMEPAAKELETYLREHLRLRNPGDRVVIANASAEAVPFDRTVDSLVAQLTSPVLWAASIRNLMSRGVDTFVEVGPKSVLTGLLKRIDRKVSRYSTDTPRALAETQALLKTNLAG
jgi:[acyl-carrier-protein] S-malonyltransferase